MLAGTLLLAQTLGLMHGVVHGVMHGPQAQGHSRGHHAHDHPDAAQAEHGAGWLASLFSSHEGDSDCRLFDQASHGSAAPCIASPSLPVAPSASVLDLSRSEALARWAALFDARGPPLTR